MVPGHSKDLGLTLLLGKAGSRMKSSPVPGSREIHLQWQLCWMDSKSVGQAACYLIKGRPSTGQGVRLTS